MATMIVRFQVDDFDRWKTVFDGMGDARREHGIADASVHRNVSDPDTIITILRAKTLRDAQAWGNSDTLREAMSRAGADGVVEIEYLEDVG
jgi:heme-degrading monooxygenase HmoA